MEFVLPTILFLQLRNAKAEIRNAKAEIARLTNQLAASRSRLQSTNEALQDTRTKLLASQFTAARLRSEKQALQSILNQTHGDLNKRTAELTNVRDLLVTRTTKLENAQGLLKMCKSDVETVQGLLDKRTAELEASKDLLDTRTAELKAAQVHLEKCAMFTALQTAEVVNSLNHKAGNIATLLVDASDTLQMESSQGGVEEVCMAETRRWIGAPMVEVLQSADKARDPQILKFAIRACIVTVAFWVLMGWQFATDEDEDMRHEPYAQVTFRTYHDAHRSGIFLLIASALSSVLLVARFSFNTAPPTSPSFVIVPTSPLSPLPSFPAISLPSISPTFAVGTTFTPPPSAVHAKLKSRILDIVGGGLNMLVDQCLQLNCAIGEGVESSSGSIVPFVVPPGTKYDVGSMMDIRKGHHSEGGERTEESTGIVLCSPGLGLRYDTKRAGESIESAWLVKSKVVLGVMIACDDARAGD